MSEPLTIAFLPEAAYGASLNCVALAQELRELGHRPVFLCDPGFAGMFGNYGFDELPVAMSPLKSDAEIADFWQRFIDQHRPHFHLSPLEQIATYEVPAWNAIVDSAIHAEPGLRKGDAIQGCAIGRFRQEGDGEPLAHRAPIRAARSIGGAPRLTKPGRARSDAAR